MNERELRRRFPEASESFIRINADDSRICAGKQECPQDQALVQVLRREEKGVSGPAKCRLCFSIFSVRPLDASNYEIKYLEDALVVAGFLPGDAWNQVEIQVASEKVHCKAQERTEIVIEEMPA